MGFTQILHRVWLESVEDNTVELDMKNLQGSIDLGDYNLLDYGGGSWKLVHQERPYNIIGGVHVYQWRPGSGIRSNGAESTVPAVRDIWLDDPFQRKGVGKLMLQALIRKYGQLRSDPTGQTSDAAARVWKSLGARSLTTLDKGFGDSWYALPNPSPA